MAELQFIDSDLYTDASRKADAFRLSQTQAQQAIEKQKQDMQFAQQSNPLRLRSMTAEASTAETGAKYAAPEAQGRIAQMGASTDSTRANTQRTQAENRLMVYGLADQGKTDEADALSVSLGHGPVPPAIKQNAQMRAALKSIDESSLKLYPSNPAAQKDYHDRKIQQLGPKIQQGQQLSPFDLAESPEGAPAPTDVSGVHNFEVVNRQEQDETGKPVVRSYRFDKRSGAMSPIEGDGVVLPRNSAGATAGAGGGLTPEAVDGAAERVLNGDPKALQNIGRGAQGAAALTAINNRVYEMAKQRGVSAQQIGTQVAAFAGQQAAMRTLGTKGANIEYAANTASRAIDFAQTAMSKVPRSQFLPIGKLQQMIDTQTNSPEQAAAFTAVNTLVNEYARVVSPTGQPTEGTRQHAREMLNTAQNHESFNATLAMMRQEIASAKAAFDQTRQEFLARGGDAVGGSSPTPALQQGGGGAPQGSILPGGAQIMGGGAGSGASSGNGTWTDPATHKVYQIINGQLHE